MCISLILSLIFPSSLLGSFQNSHYNNNNNNSPLLHHKIYIALIELSEEGARFSISAVLQPNPVTRK